MKTLSNIAAVGLFALLAAACGNGTSSSEGSGAAASSSAASATTSSLPAAPAVKTDVTAAETTCQLSAGDPLKITTYDLAEPYAVPDQANGKLMVFFPGSLAKAGEYTDIVGEAAAVGYHAVGISYPNGAGKVTDKTLTLICGNNVQVSSPYDCYDEVRHNRFDGTVEPDAASIQDPFLITGPGEAIENRLYQLLNYLGNCDGTVTACGPTSPDSSWCAFIDTTAKKPLYNQNLVLAGHSQGGGEAAYIAKLHAVSGVVMFSSPEDSAVQHPLIQSSLVTASADWLSHGTFATPLSRFYSLTHEQDEFITRIQAAWHALYDGTSHFTDLAASCADGATSNATPSSIAYGVGKPADPAPCYSTTVTHPAPPYGGAHRLYTNTGDVHGIYPYHDSTVVDAQTPACPTGSHPLLTPAWRQMLYSAGGFTTTAPTTCDG